MRSSGGVADAPPGVTHGQQINALNTGIAGAGLTLGDLATYTGPMTITTPDTIISQKVITGDLRIRTTGVLVEKCMIYGNARIDADEPGCSFTVTYCTIDVGDALGTNAYDGTGIGARDFVASWCNIYGGRRSVNCDRNGSISYSFCHNQADDPTGVSHESGIRMGADSYIGYNKIGCDALDYPPDAGCSACLTGYGDFATIERNTVEYNYISKTPGGYGAYGGSSPAKPFPNANHIIFRGNIFQRNPASQTGLTTGFYGTISDFNPAAPGNVWENNTYDGGGTVDPA